MLFADYRMIVSLKHTYSTNLETPIAHILGKYGLNMNTRKSHSMVNDLSNFKYHRKITPKPIELSI